MDLKDKVIVITGAARGIGAALARRAKEAGARGIALGDIDFLDVDALAEELDGLAVCCDVADEFDVGRLVELATDEYGPIDVFVSNAGQFGPLGGLDVSDDDWRGVLDVNFMGHVYAARAVLPRMLERGSGYLLQVVSAAGLLTHVGAAPYSVSKHAAIAWAEWLSITYGPRGIRVSCCCPLGVRTDMLTADEYLAPVIEGSALTAEEVAETMIAGLRDEKFLILPHPEVARHMARKAQDYDSWLVKMSRLKESLEGDAK